MSGDGEFATEATVASWRYYFLYAPDRASPVCGACHWGGDLVMEPWIGPRIGIVIDCNDIETMTNFWCAALRYQLRGDVGHYRSIVAPGNDEPRIIMQRVPEPRIGKNRLHIDIHVSDIEGEAIRIVGLGARRIDVTPVNEVGSRWMRMLDPEGNEFCIVEARG